MKTIKIVISPDNKKALEFLEKLRNRKKEIKEQIKNNHYASWNNISTTTEVIRNG